MPPLFRLTINLIVLHSSIFIDRGKSLKSQVELFFLYCPFCQTTKEVKSKQRVNMHLRRLERIVKLLRWRYGSMLLQRKSTVSSLINKIIPHHFVKDLKVMCS